MGEGFLVQHDCRKCHRIELLAGSKELGPSPDWVWEGASDDGVTATREITLIANNSMARRA